eukprot:snap_masked-scaffold_14-processed-gene-9.5-mRNA-1 protein AED:1.00 eAED:1.00 QI:0/-1/0/0/-1/1/1/0/72
MLGYSLALTKAATKSCAAYERCLEHFVGSFDSAYRGQNETRFTVFKVMLGKLVTNLFEEKSHLNNFLDEKYE